MSVNPSWLRMFLEMDRRHHFSRGDVLALGVQDVMFNHETAEDLLKERNIDPKVIPKDKRRYYLSRNQMQFTDDDKYYMNLYDLFEMMDFNKVDTLDAFENDKPDILWDLSTRIDESLHQKYDLLFDIGVLEHTANIFQSLENACALVKEGGWIILYLPLYSPISTCMYHPNPPFFFDNLTGNGFENIETWINWMPDWDQRTDIRTVWLNFAYNDNPTVCRDRYYTVAWYMAQKVSHVPKFKPMLQNFYKDWHAGNELLASEAGTREHEVAGLSDQARLHYLADTCTDFGKSVAEKMQGDRPSYAELWQRPTLQCEPTELQLSHFPTNGYGVPFSQESVITPVDSRPQLHIPEQMVVGDPMREQLYL